MRKLFSSRSKSSSGNNSLPSEPYQYDPLPDFRAIRLIKLSKPASDGTPVCNIKAFKLDKCPAFQALSYTWGEPLTSRNEVPEESGVVQRDWVVHVKDSTGLYRLTVSRNLYDCLVTLSRNGFSDWLWYVKSSPTLREAMVDRKFSRCDAVCINQQDVPEKAGQVSNMGIIYSAALAVIIWLGSSTEYVADVQWINDTIFTGLRNYAIRNRNNCLDLTKQLGSAIAKDYYDYIGIQDPGNRWIGYAKFFANRRWFSRGWVFQEIVLARSVVVLCGDIYLNWDILSQVARWIGSCGLGDSLNVLDLSPEWTEACQNTSFGSEIMRFADWRHRCLMGGPARQDRGNDVTEMLVLIFNAVGRIEQCYAFLELTLELIRPLNVTDPRDKIFAALGMYSKFLPPGYTPTIYPDYSMTPEQVYRHVTIRLLHVLPWLSILSHNGEPSTRNFEDLPSWVPDFSATSYTAPFCISRPEAQYNSSIPRHPNIPTRYRYIDGNTLTIYGVKLDTINGTAISLLEAAQDSDEHSKFRKWLSFVESLLETCLALPSTYINGQTRQEALWRTTITNGIGRNFFLQSSYGLKFRDWILMFLVSYGIKWDITSDLQFQNCINILAEFEISQPSNYLPTVKKVWELIDLYKSTNFGSATLEARKKFEDLNEVRNEMTIIVRSTHIQRRMFRTENGLLGLGFDSVEKEDEAWQFYDARVPFVLRRVPDEEPRRYKVIGEAYVHGVMQNELLGRYDLTAKVGPIVLV